jgi:glycosyltransferase involved in cell wall biosynthesis
VQSPGQHLASLAPTDERGSESARVREMLVTVIAPVRDMDAHALRLVQALEGQTMARERFEIVLADDGSSSGSVLELATSDGHVRVLRGPRANSYAARNRAVAAASGSIIAACDADCEPEPDWLEQGIEALENAEVVAGLIRFSASDHPSIWAILDMTTFLDQKRAVKAGYGVTANLFFKRNLFEHVGGFDDSQPNQGDYDFVSRCVAAGAKLAFSPHAVVRHPTRNRASSFLRKVWAVNRRYAERESAAGRKPEALKLRNSVPVVQTLRGRRRVGRPLALDRERLAESGVHPTVWDHVRALPLIYLLVPYVSLVAQLRGWVAGRRRRMQSFAPAGSGAAEASDV